MIVIGGYHFPSISFAETKEASVPTQGHFIKESGKASVSNSSTDSRRKIEVVKPNKKSSLPKLNEAFNYRIVFSGVLLLLLLLFCLMTILKNDSKRC